MTPLGQVHRWSEVPLEKVTAMVSRKVVAGSGQVLMQVYLKRGAQVPLHTHTTDQMVYVLEGRLRYRVDGRELLVGPGEVLHVPSGIKHQAEALEDTFELAVLTSPLAPPGHATSGDAPDKA